MEYIVTEKENLNSQRIGYIVETKKLVTAKRLASQNQCFQNTVLTIEWKNANGEIVLLAHKEGNSWYTLVQGSF